MQIAKQMAGFTPAEADDLRKAIGKKIHALMASLKEKFLEGCAANDVTPAVANQLWKDMEQSQDYSFNKAHAACYALIAYRTAWLQREPPVRVHGRADLVGDEHEGPRAVLRQRVRRDGDRGAAAGRQLVAGRLRGRRGEDPLRAERREERRRRRARARSSRAREEGGPFASIWDFTERVDPQVVNKRALESLVKCGALDSTGATRKGMLERARAARSRWGSATQADRLAGQGSIFDLGDERGGARPKHHPTIAARRVRASPSCCGSRRRRSASTSPSIRCTAIRDQLRRKTDCDARRARAPPRRRGRHRRRHRRRVKQLTTKKGEPMVFLRLDDVTGGAEVVVFNSVYAAARELCVADRILVVKGRVDHKQRARRS